MNNDTNHPLNSTGADGLGLPADSAGLPPIPSTPPPPPPPLPEPQPLVETVIPTPTEPIAPPTPPTDVPSPSPVISKIPSIPAGPTIPSVIPTEAEGSFSEPPKPSEDKPKKKVNKKLVFGGTLILLLLGGALAIAAQFGLFRGDLRQRASGGVCCEGFKCNATGQVYGSDQNYGGGA